MLVCLHQGSGNGCGAVNPDGSTHCQSCGRNLRYALFIHNPGTIIGSYQVDTVIGHGGFGVVYKAENTHHSGRWVALKETFDQQMITAFAQEFATSRCPTAMRWAFDNACEKGYSLWYRTHPGLRPEGLASVYHTAKGWNNARCISLR